MRRWQEEGDGEALDELLRLEVRMVRDLIVAKGSAWLGGSAGASDLAQEAVLRLLQLDDLPKFADPGALRGYLWVTAWRLLLQRVRRPYRRKQSLDVTTSSPLDLELAGHVESKLETTERATALELAMNLLPEADRDLIHRVYFVEEKLAAVAQDLGLSESAAKMRLLRARRLLAARLAAWEKTIG